MCSMEISEISGVCETCKKHLSMDKKKLSTRNGKKAMHIWVNSLKVESADCKTVYKMDCIGHVKKRMGTHLGTYKQKVVDFQMASP